MNKIQKIYKILSKAFGKQNWWPAKTRFEVIIGAILTQNTNWKNVEKAIINLKKHKLLNKKAVKEIPESKLASLIRSSGYYKQKARKLKEFVNFKGNITRENLLKIWGLGPETVDSILLYAYDKPVFVIDAYTKRVMARLGYKQKDYDSLQKLFTKNLPKNFRLFNEYHALLVELAKRNCKNIPVCKNCPLREICK